MCPALEAAHAKPRNETKLGTSQVLCSFAQKYNMDRGFLIFYYIVRIIQGIIGIVGNSLIIVVILKFKTLNNSHVLIWSLAMGDLLASIIGSYK